MILADKITEERKKNGWSQEELADQLGVSRQAVSKWESAGSVPDLQRIIQLADVFGVSTDYLLKDEMENDAAYPVTYVEPDHAKPIRRVSMEEANEFLEMKRKSAPIIANATFLCIISPVLLVLLATLADAQIGKISETLAAGIGLLFLFGAITVAVAMFITNGTKESHVEHLSKEYFETEYGVTGMVKERRGAYEYTFTKGLVIGVVLCILSVVPLVMAGLQEAPDYVCGALTALLLVMIATGVNIMIRVGTIKSSFDTLLQEGEYSKEEKKAKGKLDALSGIYWCLVTAIYLGWSFWTMRWNFTWIVWPVAGVLFAAIHGVMRMVIGIEDKN